jgi:hypothetical protein
MISSYLLLPQRHESRPLILNILSLRAGTGELTIIIVQRFNVQQCIDLLSNFYHVLTADAIDQPLDLTTR